MNEEQLEELLEYLRKEREYANRCYDRACSRNDQRQIEFYVGTMGAFAQVESKIKEMTRS